MKSNEQNIRLISLLVGEKAKQLLLTDEQTIDNRCSWVIRIFKKYLRHLSQKQPRKLYWPLNISEGQSDF